MGWQGDELMAVRLHLPSRVPFHNSPSRTVERGNIIAWEQPLSARAKGEPLAIEVHMEQDSILFQTLALFAGMAVLALAALALFIWWVQADAGQQSRDRSIERSVIELTTGDGIHREIYRSPDQSVRQIDPGSPSSRDRQIPSCRSSRATP